MRFLLLPACLLALAGNGGPLRAAQGIATAGLPTPGLIGAPETVIELSPLRVTSSAEDEHFDRTGMGSQESEQREPPFSNDLLGGAATPDEPTTNLDVELGQIANPNPADLSAGQSRVDVRGFPSPRRRNGFTQLGIPEVLNIERGEQITGPLCSVTGRAVPGGINNYMTGRPKAQPVTSLGFSLGSLDSQRAFADTTRTLKPKKAWSRNSLSWFQQHGPETYTYQRQRSSFNSATWRASRATSLMVQADFADAWSNPSGGVPEYRTTRGAKIEGPWRPLALFHSNGPECFQRKQVGSLALQYEGQAGKSLSLRATGQYFFRRFTEERFSRGEYLLDQKVFSGTREPFHNELGHDAVTAQLEATWRVRGLGGDHKLLASLEGSGVSVERLQRGLETADRALLPASARTLDPAAPDYSRPAYSEERYSRRLTDRGEDTLYGTAFVSSRSAWWNGRLVGTTGLRQDRVWLRIADHRSNASFPLVRDTTGKVSWHAGANWIALPGRVLAFANTSTAFEPSLRIDARTGRIQGNETTAGGELGATGLAFRRKLSFTLTGFSYANRNIARRNPLYESPVYDPDHTQPQLLAAGEERFRGGAVDLGWKPRDWLTLNGRHTHTSAVTTASPDLPEEIGRQLSRLPVDASSLSLRASALKGVFKGASAGLSATYVGPYTAWYESSTRKELKYPGYTVLSGSLGLRYTKNKRTHSLSLGLRNLLDTDLLAKQARVGQGRETTLGYSLTM